ncbi:MAG: hypothetical protein IPP83_01170 [Flavobacteriales bacterium]|nr:hypothetical protein [Flavobacteriales bacterium]
MKKILVTGSSSTDQVLIKELKSDRLQTSYVNGGSALVHELLVAYATGRSDVGYTASLAVVGSPARSIRMAVRDHDTIRLKERVGGLGPDGEEQPVPARAGSDLLVVVDRNTQRKDREELKGVLHELGVDAGLVLDSGDPGFFLKGAQHPFGPNSVLVIDARDLQELDARIERGRSWDRTFGQLLAHAQGSGKRIFSAFGHVLVRFGCDAVVHFEREAADGPRVTAHYEPASADDAAHTDADHGQAEAFLAALIIDLARSGASASDRILFAIKQAMTTVHRIRQAGWHLEGDRLARNTSAFDAASSSMDPIPAVDITRLPEHHSLLNLVMHGHARTLDVWAMDYVRRGNTGMLGGTPMVAFGALLTVDRDEIEQYRDLHRNVRAYLSKPGKKPLSFGVFGAPGSGKSFGVEQIADSLGPAVKWTVKNFSEYVTKEDMVRALHALRDVSIRGSTPFVLIDEFDSTLQGEPYGWFRHWLAPLNDGVFKDGDIEHPLGPAVLVFTGGTSSSFAEFRAHSKGGDPPLPEQAEKARERKLPDMASRLEEHIDVKGVSHRPDEPDGLHVARRAVVLRSLLLRAFGLKEEKGKPVHIPIAGDVLFALLNVPTFRGNTRSLQKLIAACDPGSAGKLTRARIPSTHSLDNYVDPHQFTTLMETYDAFDDVYDELAEMIHERWRTQQDPADTKSANVPWDVLPEEYRASNRHQAMDMIRKLEIMGYGYEKLDGPAGTPIAFTPDEVEAMARLEHDRWMKEKLAAGWVYGPERDNDLRIHTMLRPYDALSEPEKEMDREPVRNIPGDLMKVGYRVVEKLQVR